MDYDAMTRRVLARAGEYEKQRKKRRKTALRVGVPALCALALAVGIAYAAHRPVQDAAAPILSGTPKFVTTTPPPAAEASYAAAELDEVVSWSSLAASGEITARSEPFGIRSVSGGLMTYYDWTLSIDEIHRGACEEETVTVRTMQNLEEFLSVGDKVLLFLYRPNMGGSFNTEGDYYYLASEPNGIFKLLENEAGPTVQSWERQETGKDVFLQNLEALSAQYPINENKNKEEYLASIQRNLKENPNSQPMEEALTQLEQYATIVRYGTTLQIPAIELPEPEAGAMADMIGLVVWHGAVYTQAQGYTGADAERMLPLAAQHLGTARGTIDEWSTQDDYATELASTGTGEVYTVSGYDPDFRLCVVDETKLEDGTAVPWIWFMERLNGIDLGRGEDLLDARLCLPGRIESVRYQTHDDWNEGRNNMHPLDDVQAVERLIEAACAGQFEYVHDEQPDFYSREGKQAHLYLTLTDGTVTELRLFEDGWVGYQPLGWYFVHIPGEAFDAVFDACE